jgi:hypothetical protein
VTRATDIPDGAARLIDIVGLNGTVDRCGECEYCAHEILLFLMFISNRALGRENPIRRYVSKIYSYFFNVKCMLRVFCRNTSRIFEYVFVFCHFFEYSFGIEKSSSQATDIQVYGFELPQQKRISHD